MRVLRVGYSDQYNDFTEALEAARVEAQEEVRRGYNDARDRRIKAANEVDLRFGDFTAAIAGNYQRKRLWFDIILWSSVGWFWICGIEMVLGFFN